jgi:hypothetical protein
VDVRRKKRPEKVKGTKMTELKGDTTVRANLTFVGKTIGLVGSAVWFYSSMVADIQRLEVELMRVQHEIQMNSEFRVKWPRGELGSLPDDAEQNMRLLFLEKSNEKHEELIEKLRYGGME